MTLVLPTAAGLRRLTEQLDAGIPIIVPLPSPLPYVVAGTDAGAVNDTKGRPRSQPVGVGLRATAEIEPAMMLDRGTIDLVRWLLHAEGVGVLVPVDADAPAWLSPAIVDNRAFLGGAWLPELAGLTAGRTHVYMSSGNATSDRPAVTAAQAEAVFGSRLLVADGDALRDGSVTHGSSTMVAVAPGGKLTVARRGINNLAFGHDDIGYVADLRRRWAAR
jgi:hypothetical protein